MKNISALAFCCLCVLAWHASNSRLLTAQDRFGAPALLTSGDAYGGVPSWQGSSWLGWGGASTVPDWRLGVQVDNTETGVYIKQIAPGSAAARVNLEVGDMIVAVGGQQVGYVDRQPIDLTTIIRSRADTTGNVSLLVQDSRTGKLASIRVQLDGAQNSLRGQVVIRDRVAIPADAQVTVFIENLTRPYYTVRNGEVSTYVRGQYVIPFEIPYDANYIASTDAYQVRARITSGGRMLFDTIQPVRVLTNNSPLTDVQIAVAPISLPPGNVVYNQSPSGQSPVITAGYPNGYQNVDLLTAQYRQAYRRYLGRDPSQLEMAALMASPPSSNPNDLAIQLMASQQFYDLMGNNNTLWLTNVFQQIIGRPAQADELAQWTRRLMEVGGSRTELLRQLFQQKQSMR